MADISEKVVGIAIALLVAAVIVPIGISELSGLTGEVDVISTVTNENLGFDNVKAENSAYSGNLDNTPLVENTLVVRAYIDNTLTSFTAQSDNDNVIVLNHTTSAYLLNILGIDNDTTIYGSYRYVSGTAEWGSGLLILMQVLLPVLAVIGIILYITRRD